MGRMQVNKPTLVGEDPLPPGESTRSTVTRRLRRRRAAYWLPSITLTLRICI